jgi:ribose transport system permease protein
VSDSTDVVGVDAPARKPKPRHRENKKVLLEGLERGGLPLLMALMFTFFAVDSTSGHVFTSTANLDNILGDQAVTGLVALAMVVPLASGYFDLSVSATTGVANVAMAAVIGTHGWPVALGIPFVLAIGGVIGFLNGFLVAKLRLNAFVVTLGSYTLLGGLALYYTGGRLLSGGIPASFGDWGGEKWIGLPRPFVLLMLMAFAVWYVLTQTPFGRYLEGIGSNEGAARLVGINVNRTVWVSFILSGMLAAAAGILQTSRAGNGSAETANAFLFPAFAAVFLGATTIRPGRYNVWGTIIGVYFVAMSVSGFSLLGAEIWVQPVFNGVSLLFAVALSTFFARQRDRSRSRSELAEAEAEAAATGSGGVAARRDE